MVDNPYVSPKADPTVQADGVPAKHAQSLPELARSIFLDWEKLRLIYVGILAALVLIAALPPSSTSGNPRFWLMVVEGAVIANVCFFAGPVVETYVSWLGFRSKVLRVLLFVLGTTFACLLAIAVMAFELIPTPD